MKSYTKYIFVLIAMMLVAGCSSTRAVGEAEMSRGDHGSRVGISNVGDGPEVYGSIRTGVSFK